NPEQASGHQQVADKEDSCDRLDPHVKQEKAHEIQPGRPALVRSQRRHDVGLTLAQQLVNRNDLEAAGAGAFYDHGQGLHGFGAVAPAIVQQNDVSAALIVLGARRQVSQHLFGNLLGAAVRIIAPVAGIELVAHGDIAQVLRGFERAHLIFGVGLLIDRIGWPEENGSDAEPAGKQLLGQVQFQLHEHVRDVRDIGMAEGVIADLMAFVVDPPSYAAELVGLYADQEKRGRRVLAFENVQYCRGPLRIRPVVKRQGNLIRTRTVTADTVRVGQQSETFIFDESGTIDTYRALSIGRSALD